MSKCLKFCPGLKFKANFHSKMSVCRHELGGVNSQPPTIPTLGTLYRRSVWMKRVLELLGY